MKDNTTKIHFGNNRGTAFVTDDGELFLIRCPRCELENHSMAVASGKCAFCLWKEGDSLE